MKVHHSLEISDNVKLKIDVLYHYLSLIRFRGNQYTGKRAKILLLIIIILITDN